MAPRPTHNPPRVLAYVRVSTDEQHAKGGGLDAQRAIIHAEVECRGWELVQIVGEAAGSSSATLERAGLQRVLARLDAGEADVLLVAKLDRLSRSVADGAKVMERAQRKGWSLVALDFGLDTTTPAGEMVGNMLLSVAQYERRLIGQRTREGLSAKRAQGVRLGRPQSLPDAVVQRISDERAAGASLRAIARGLEADGVATARGGTTWQASTVQSVLGSQAASRLAG